MPLNPVSLQSALEDLFATPPLTAAECAQAWGNAVGSYAAGVIPASTTASAAATTLTAALESAFGASDAAPDFDAAFMTFATTVAGGMLPAFTGTPPAAALDVSTLLSATQPTHAAAAGAFASHIDAWMKTGTAVSVPPGVSVMWT